jgi:hypothetical protein
VGLIITGRLAAYFYAENTTTCDFDGDVSLLIKIFFTTLNQFFMFFGKYFLFFYLDHR